MAAGYHTLTSYFLSSSHDSAAPAGNVGVPLRPAATGWLHVHIVYDRSFKAAEGGGARDESCYYHLLCLGRHHQ